MRAVLLACLLLLPHLSHAQDRAGNDTAGDWVVDHYKPFGLWDSACDHRTTDGARTERCYLRYVDVFSPRPDFAAQFLFVTPGPEIEIGIERGTLFPRGGLRVVGAAGTLWETNRILCRTGLTCTFEGEAAETLLAAMTEGQTFAFDFTDRHGKAQALRWDLAPFAAAFADFTRETLARGLN